MTTILWQAVGAVLILGGIYRLDRYLYTREQARYYRQQGIEQGRRDCVQRQVQRADEAGVPTSRPRSPLPR